ncbi:glycosyltransferase [Martelella lutilitoris]|uniref:Glycosyltransferase n=1 Tax=Martelella lutilitoris TaxID=2583532 RepID=A0A5C4JM24_9HYPH|nr:glycosyltransferase [Martelella lutilitoris]TNB46368.1 glycosyltransferase [Martelella lutilitoris]
MQEFLSRNSLISPETIVESGWLGHAPFAFHLISELNPKVFVELGTHNGFSYFCFCQAIKKHDLQTASFAVDTWVGDEHAGFYGEEVFENVSRVNESYSAFSRLVRSTFSDAVSQFPDGYINLLHIDGRHFYEDAKNDFEEWLPKLSQNAIVLFHDTQVREREFGVWKLFGELSEKYPTFNFHHQHGLGVLALGEVPECLAPFMNGDDDTATEIRQAYSLLGDKVAREWNALVAKADRDALRDETGRQKVEMDRLRAALEGAEATAAKYEKQYFKLAHSLDQAEKNTIKVRELSDRREQRIDELLGQIGILTGLLEKGADEIPRLDARQSHAEPKKVAAPNGALARELLKPKLRALNWKASLRHPFSSRKRKKYRQKQREKMLRRLDGSILMDTAPASQTVRKLISRRKARYTALYRHPFNARKRRAYRRNRIDQAQLLLQDAFVSEADPRPETICSSRPISISPRLWFYVGDTLDWLEAHQRLTGVGRVSVEILNAALSEERVDFIPCRTGRTGLDLIGMSGAELNADLFSKLGGSYQEGVGKFDAVRAPSKGDHVFFTGLVWTPKFTALFRHLFQKGIGFSVLVHDIIPLEGGADVDEAQSRRFAEWLTVALQTADRIYVSTEFVRAQILRWAILEGVEVGAQIVKAPFGAHPLKQIAAPEKQLQQDKFADLEVDDFVLSVGTIDARKNQAMLCRLWRLLLEKGHDVPQLVLAGRNDAGLGSRDSIYRDLVETGKLVVLSGLDDEEIAALTQACRFTAFPSLSEGYGLPVVESLQHGKLCLASNLPPVMEQAKDFAWYFDPNDLEGAVGVFLKALNDRPAVEAAEDRIKREFSRPTWSDAVDTLRSEGLEAAGSAPVPVISGCYRPYFPGAARFSTDKVMKRAARWCTSVDPDVSILIVNWNASALTLECIRQIWLNTEGYTYEIVIVDNGSGEEDIERLSKPIPGVTFIKIGCNRFFGEANNIAAEAARGKYVVLLNNDAFPQSGWLSAMRRMMDENPSLGAVGPMFLWPDGRVQEAGGTINEGGYPVRYGRDQDFPTQDILSERYVDYISAAALLIDREMFIAAAGFDLTFEPAYYEDSDLCFKLRALGRPVAYCPDSRVIHIEGAAANGNTKAEARRKALGDANRDKFVARWGEFLRKRDDAALSEALADFVPDKWSTPPQETAELPVAVVYTPYSVTPGGGERYLFSAARQLARTHRVEVVTPNRYSDLRLRQIGSAFDLDLGMLCFKTLAEFEKGPDPDLMLTMGNAALPPVAGRGRVRIYHCQFPFQLKENASSDGDMLQTYQAVMVNSTFTEENYRSRCRKAGLPAVPTRIVYPPVPLVEPAASRRRMILSVGRFFVGGHSKRQDLQIEAFRKLIESGVNDVELHLAGSSFPEASDIDFLASIREAAADLPVFFHVNCPIATLRRLYAESLIYWHATGLGRDLQAEPEKAEHFGISLVEAMSGGAIPVALRAGGPTEIVTDGLNGFFFEDLDGLVVQTRRLLNDTSDETLEMLSLAAHSRASDFGYQRFESAVSSLFAQDVAAGE